MRQRYDEVTGTEWWALARQGNKVACCSCGLVHTVDYRLNKKKKCIEVRFARDERATAALRRENKRRVEKGGENAFED